MRADETCPCCGRPYPVTEPPTEVHVGGSLRQAVVNIIAAHKDGITLRDLSERLYPGRQGVIGRSIPVLICKANKFLEPQGYRIVSTMGRGTLLPGGPERQCRSSPTMRLTFSRSSNGKA